MAPESYSSPELRALTEAGTSLTSELSLDAVLQKVVDVAREQVKAQYGALSVLGKDGTIEQFLTSGISQEERERIGDLPRGKGLLGVILKEGTVIRMDDMSKDSRSYGFPPHHPAMRSLLGVPVVWAGRVIGNLYLAEKEGGSFTERDEEIVLFLATQAAVAIRNAELYGAEQRYAQEWRELFELGRDVTAASASLPELLDSVVQRARRLLGTDCACIMLLDSDNQTLRMAAHDGLRTEGMRRLRLLSEHGLQGLAIESMAAVVVTDYQADPRLKNRPARLVREEGLISQICVPLVGKSGAIGTLTVGNRYRTPFPERAVEIVEALANWVAVAIENSRLQAQLESLARLEERDRIAMDLHDGVIQSIYAVGLQLEDVAERLEESPAAARDRIEATINSLNTVIKDIRSYIFDLRPSASSVDDLPVAIRELAEELRVNTLIEADVTTDGELNGRMSDAQALGLYHIAQEALTNIGKHSRASTAHITLSTDGRSVRLEVTDNGRGLPAEEDQHQGQGMRNMRDRAKAIGASIAFDSRRGKGTTMRVVMPLTNGSERADG